MTPSPAVSVILPTHNRIEYLKEAVNSVRAQTLTDWELIVVVDGSTDGSAEWLENLGDPRIMLVRNAHRSSCAAARNAGLPGARAKWIAFLDDDDRWAPNKLARQLAFHSDHPAVRWSYTAATKIDATGRPLSPDLFRPWVPHSGQILEQVLSLEANIAAPSVMVEAALLRELGGFNETCRAEDFELWVRLAERCECGLVDEPLLEIRKHRAVSFQWPEISLGFTEIYQAFADRTADPLLREQSHTRAAYHAVDAADRFGMLGQWSDAAGAVRLALRIRPRAPFAYRAAWRLVWRRIRAAVSSDAPPRAEPRV